MARNLIRSWMISTRQTITGSRKAFRSKNNSEDYLEDRLHSVEIVANEQNINISYGSKSKEEKEKKKLKRKGSRLSLRGTSGSSSGPASPKQMDDARPDKREPLEKRTLKKKSREAIIGTRV